MLKEKNVRMDGNGYKGINVENRWYRYEAMCLNKCAYGDIHAHLCSLPKNGVVL